MLKNKSTGSGKVFRSVLNMLLLAGNVGSRKRSGMAEEESFPQLWERVQGGDRDAWAQLYLESAPHLRWIVGCHLRDLKIHRVVEADDILNSFFVHLLANTKISFCTALHFTNYCERALRNMCVTVLRWQFRRKAISIDACEPEHLWDRRATGADMLEWDEQLAHAYARLTGRERLVCRLAATGSSWSEIGQQLNASAHAVRKVRQRAADRVRNEVLAAGCCRREQAAITGLQAKTPSPFARMTATPRR
jgi:RNA polymerase sigma factor (sigma-70 family)